MIRGALELDSGLQDPPEGEREVPPRGIADGGVVEAGPTRRGRRAAAALPGVEADVVVIAAGRDEGGLRPEARGELKAEDAAIERQRAFEVGHLEVDVPDVRAGGDGIG